MVMASRKAENVLTCTDTHAPKGHNRRSGPLPPKMSGWGAFLTPGGSRQVFFERGAR